jgi:hypothetical protein
VLRDGNAEKGIAGIGKENLQIVLLAFFASAKTQTQSNLKLVHEFRLLFQCGLNVLA